MLAYTFRCPDCSTEYEDRRSYQAINDKGNRSLGEGIIRKNGVRRGCTPPADTIFSGSYPLQVGELNGYR